MSKFHLSVTISGILILLSLFFGHMLYIVLILTVFNILMIRGVTSLSSGFFGPAIVSIPKSNSVYLTFDDGPDPKLTPAVLDLLKDYSFKATFFLIGERAERYPDLVRRIIQEGHLIGSHDLDHRWWANFRPTGKIRRDISESERILEQITGKKVSIYRPPVGLSNPHLHKVCRESDYTIVGWNRAARDGGNRICNAIEKIPALPLNGGDIILLHDTAPDDERRKLFLKSLNSLFKRIKSRQLPTDILDILRQ